PSSAEASSLPSGEKATALTHSGLRPFERRRGPLPRPAAPTPIRGAGPAAGRAPPPRGDTAPSPRGPPPPPALTRRPPSESRRRRTPDLSAEASSLPSGE